MLISLVAMISAVLIGWGAWNLSRGKQRFGLICLASALGPAGTTPALVIDALVSFNRGNRKGATKSLVGAIALALLSAGGAAMYWGSNKSDGALWMSLVGLEVAIAVGIFYSAVYAYLGTQRLAILMVLRFLAIISLLLILFKPAISFSAADSSSKPYLLVLVDRSGSMSVKDSPQMPDRYTQAVQMLTSQLPRIQKNFRPVWHHFGTALETAESLDALSKRKPSGDGSDGTNIAKAIRAAGSEYRRGDVTGIMLLSDGIDNGGELINNAVVEAGMPIYTVGLGAATESAAGKLNLGIASVDAPLEAIANNTVNVNVSVRATRLGNATSEVLLYEEGSDQPVARAPIQTSKSADLIRATLKWTPRGSGAAPAAASKPANANVRKLRLSIPKNPAETITEDNNTELHVMITEPRIRVLYVEGSMRPENKFLKRLLDTDVNIRYTGLVRYRDNKFSAYGTPGGRQLEGLPNTEEEFRQFDVIILGDLDRTFLNNNQMALIRKFVDNGGGLIMLGGHNSFGPGGYSGTDIEALLPVVTGPRGQPQETTAFVPQLTAEGETHPIFEGIAKFFSGPGGRAPSSDPKLPELLGCVTVQKLKPGASALALHPTRRNEEGPLPVLAVQNFGKGHTAAFTADTTWRWYMELQQSLGADSPYTRFWAQTIRWLANVQIKSRDVAASAVLRLDRTYAQVGEKVKFLARVQDAKGHPAEGVQATCTITAAQGGAKIETLPLAPALGKGLFELEYRPLKAGQYIVKLNVADSTGQTLGSDEMPLAIAYHSAEMEHLARNDGLLQLVAQNSDGRYSDISGLPDVIDYILERQKASAPTQAAGQTYYLYNFALLFFVFVGLLTGEWVLRRMWQLH